MGDYFFAGRESTPGPLTRSAARVSVGGVGLGVVRVDLDVDPRPFRRAMKSHDAARDDALRPGRAHAIRAITSRESVVRKALGEFD